MKNMQTARIRPRAAAALLLLGGVAASGCATKKDIKLLRDEVIALQTRHDSTRVAMERQYRALFDTLRTGQMAQLDQAGQTSHRFRQLEESLDRTQQMLTDLQVLVTDLRAQLDEQRATQRAVSPYGTGQGPPPVGNNVAANMLSGAQRMLQEGSPVTARLALEQLLAEHPYDPVAPDAQFFLAMTYEREGDHERAIAEMRKVWGQWPNAPRVAQAMLQAGIIAEEGEGDRELALEFYRDVRSRFPGSPEAQQALQRSGGA